VRTYLDTVMQKLTAHDRDIAGKMFRFLVTPSRTKIAHTASDLAGFIDRPEERVALILQQLGEMRILRSVHSPDQTGMSRYEIYHDVLADAVLDWQRRHTARAKFIRRQWIAAALVAGAFCGLMLLVYLNHLRNEAKTKDLVREKEENATWVATGEIASYLAKQPGKQFDALVFGIKAVGPSLDKGEDPPDKATKGLRDAVAEVGNIIWLRSNAGRIRSAEFSPNSRLAMTIGNDEVAVWEVDSGALVRRLKSEEGQRWESARFSPDSSHLSLQSVLSNPAGKESTLANQERPEGSTLSIIDVSSGEKSGTIQYRLGTSPKFAISVPQVLVVGLDNKLQIWDTKTGTIVKTLEASKELAEAFLSPGATRVLVRERDRSASLWNARTARLVVRLKPPTTGNLLFHNFSDDDRFVGAVSQETSGAVALLIWDALEPGNGQVSKVIELPRQVIGFMFTPDSTKVVVLLVGEGISKGFTYEAITYEVMTGKQLYRWSLPAARAVDGTNGPFALIKNVAPDSSLTLVDITTGQTVFKVKPPPILSLDSARLSNDQKRITSISGGNAAQIWSVGEGPLNVADWIPERLLRKACEQVRYQPEFDNEDVKRWCHDR
jgi:WD40 repeat protein